VQSESTTQLPLHEFGPHVYGSHDTSCSAGQPPAPSQVAERTATPELHDPPRQVVSLAGYVHAVRFDPSHEPPQIVPSLWQAGRELRGAPPTGMHVPFVAGSAHASH
jgi:hypothetical protein